MTTEKSEVPILSVLKNKLQEKSVELGDELRDNLALDSIAKAQIIKTLMEQESFFLSLLGEAKKTLQDKAVVFNQIEEIEITNAEVLAKMTKWVRLSDVVEVQQK